MAPPLIINVCLTGTLFGKENNPHLPVTIDAMIKDALTVIDAGATMLHLHPREADGAPAWRPERLTPVLEAVRQTNPDVVLVVSTSGRCFPEFEKRAAVLELDGPAKPDMASLTLGSWGPVVNVPEMIVRLAERMMERKIKPELEVFDPGMLANAFHGEEQGWLPPNNYVNLMLGFPGGAPGRVLNLAQLAREIPAGWTWAAAGGGKRQLTMNTAALSMEGHVRVGLEDNLFIDWESRTPATNLLLVERIVRLAGELGRPIAAPAETRNLLGLPRP